MLVQADARQLPLRDASVECVVTSPPYFGLRNYNDHPRQIGQEMTPAAYVDSLVEVFAEVRRVLKDDGTVWLNLGDSYAAGGYLKPKDLIGIPWRVAFALQDDGWYLRSDVIWSKPQCLPESVTDRPTRSHEYLFLLTKSPTYYYDADAIREPHAEQDRMQSEKRRAQRMGRAVAAVPGGGQSSKGIDDGDVTPSHVMATNPDGRNKRTVWSVAPVPYKGAHFATMPPKLVEPCIAAGSRAGGMVLDPFVGSGTVVAVAQRLGRYGVGVDLGYQDLARERTAQRGLMFV